MNTAPENITALKPNEIFVFGSNRAGRHGAGAARTAHKLFGAEYGVGNGPTGQCYAIPTKWLTPTGRLETMPLNQIAIYVERFIEYARLHPENHFLVTKIGCGLAGFAPERIAPLFFAHGEVPQNVSLPREFWECRA